MRNGVWFGMEFKEILRVYNISQKEGLRTSQFYRPGRPLVGLPSREDNLPNKIFGLFTHETIRRGEDYIYDHVVRAYLEKIDSFAKEGSPIEFVFLGFPFKCHNPIETLRRTPDLGELAFLLRLLDIDATIRQVYPPGVKFTVLKEGNAYKDFFGATGEEVNRFEDRLKLFVHNLGAEEKIDFVDFASVCKKFSDFENECLYEKESLQIRQNEETTHREIKALVPVMMRSVPIVEKVPFDDLIKVYDYDLLAGGLTDFQAELRRRLLERAGELAISYLAFQRAKNKLKVIPESFSKKLYVSTTAKPSRYNFHPIHRRTRFFPHHGVPVFSSEKVDVVFLREIIKSPATYVAVFCDDDIEDSPFYFLKGRQHLKM